MRWGVRELGRHTRQWTERRRPPLQPCAALALAERRVVDQRVLAVDLECNSDTAGAGVALLAQVDAGFESSNCSGLLPAKHAPPQQKTASSPAPSR
eukprot:7379111-Prymnesium_polylepis.1